MTSSDPWYQRLILAAAGASAALVFAGAVLDAISNATNLISPFITYVVSAVLLVGSAGVHLLLNRFPLRWQSRDGELLVTGLGHKAVFAIAGLLVLSWVPRAAEFFRAVNLERNIAKQPIGTAQVLPSPAVVFPETVYLLMIDTSQSLRGAPILPAVNEYVRKTDPRIRIALGTFDREFKPLMYPGRYPTSLYLRKLTPLPNRDAHCTQIYDSIEGAVKASQYRSAKVRRLVLFTDAREYACPGAQPRDWEFERDFPGFELEFVLLGQADAAEVKRLFPKALIDRAYAGVGGMRLEPWEISTTAKHGLTSR